MTDTLLTPAPEMTGTTAAPRRICFVCTGNTCRSPMAAAVFNHFVACQTATACAWLGEHPDTHPMAVSAGLDAMDGAPITNHAVTALEEAGIPSTPGNNYRQHTARVADATLLASCDLIVGISRRHAMALMLRYPELSDRITSLPHDIPDPFCGDLNVYRTCLTALIQGIREMFFPEEQDP